MDTSYLLEFLYKPVLCILRQPEKEVYREYFFMNSFQHILAIFFCAADIFHNYIAILKLAGVLFVRCTHTHPQIIVDYYFV